MAAIRLSTSRGIRTSSRSLVCTHPHELPTCIIIDNLNRIQRENPVLGTDTTRVVVALDSVRLGTRMRREEK